VMASDLTVSPESVERMGTGTSEDLGAGPRSIDALRVALVYDLDGCRLPTGVTRHALAQLERLSRRPEVALTLVAGRMGEPDGLAYWEALGDLRRRELPVAMRHLLRWWRVAPWPTVET